MLKKINKHKTIKVAHIYSDIAEKYKYAYSMMH